MFSFKIILALSVVIFSSQIQYIHGIIQDITKHRLIDETGYFEGVHSFNEGVSVYAICNKDDNNSNITICKIVQEKYPYEKISNSCRLTFKNITYVSSNVGISALGKDKAIFYWFTSEKVGSYFINIGSVDFQTCDMNSVQIPTTWRLPFMDVVHINNLVTYDDDSFDIFYQDPDYHPENGALYKIQIDGSGKMKSRPEIANTILGRYFEVLSVATQSPSQGYVYVMRKQKDFSRNPKFYVWLVRPDGLSKQLGEYYRSFGDVSAGNGLIGLCSKSETNSDITCTQYNKNGKIKFSSILPNTQNADFIKSYNLPEGGLLVMYGEIKCDYPYGCQETTKYEVVKISSDGKKTGSLNSQFNIIPYQFERPFIYKNEEQGYCATMHIETASEQQWNGENTTIVSKCFSDDDLSLKFNFLSNKLLVKRV